ncbi:MAG: hypothetical protein JWN53_2401 [Gemmatimonadetes bacterium]|jgi:hypothetical protein|nr:hypothetical protein [Gemmatimonadota bacterium]
MAIKYTIDQTRGLVRGHAFGVLTSEQLRDQYARMMADPSLRHDYRQLVDLREVTEVQVDEGELRAAATMYLFDAGIRRAFVVSGDAAYRFAVRFASHARETGQFIQVFRSMDEAEEWLEIAAPPESRRPAP